MEIEIVDAYLIQTEKKEKDKGWSLHVYFPDWEMDIRGITLQKEKKGWMLRMPFKKNFDSEEGKAISFPVISFLEKEKTRGFVQSIKEKAIPFVEKKVFEMMEEEEKKKNKRPSKE